MKAWDASFWAHKTIIAVKNGEIVGFGDMDETGYLDRLYVHKDYQGQGVASAICDELERFAAGKTFTTHASIKAKLLFQHPTLPMGEFAIGTNTTAYAMGQKYGISHLLPILIAEKTGPHFAFGDTCFSHEEELVTYNPDGKQMMAKENRFFFFCHTEPSKAYFNCHTDVTIPYHELGDIIVHCRDGREIVLIQKGRFVLEGTEELNRVL